MREGGARWGQNWRKGKGNGEGERENSSVVNQETPGKLGSAGACETQVLPALGCWAVGPHTSVLTSLCPHLSKWVAAADLLAVGL